MALWVDVHNLVVRETNKNFEGSPSSCVKEGWHRTAVARNRAQPRRTRRAHALKRFTTNVSFCPPKPKEFERQMSTFALRALFGT